MALPTAQLGSMAGLNVPSSIPTVERRKDPKLWEQVLLNLLAGAAGEVIGQGVENTMAQDYAGEFGETPESGIMKALRGPRVGERDATQRRGDVAAGKRQDADIAAADSRQRKDILARQTSDRFNQTKDLQRETGVLDSRIRLAEMENANTDAEMAMRERLANRQYNLDDRQAYLASLRDQVNNAEATKRGRESDAAALQRTTMQIGADSGLRSSQQAENEARARQLNQQTNFTYPQGGGTPGGKPIDPDLKNSRGAIAVQTQSKEQQIRAMIDELVKTHGFTEQDAAVQIAEMANVPQFSPGLAPVDPVEKVKQLLYESAIKSRTPYRSFD